MKAKMIMMKILIKLILMMKIISIIIKAFIIKKVQYNMIL